MKWVGQQIKAVREVKYPTRVQAARKAKMSDRTLERMEDALYPEGGEGPTSGSIRAISKVLKVDPVPLLRRLGYDPSELVDDDEDELSVTEQRLDRLEDLLERVVNRLDRIEPGGDPGGQEPN